MCVYGCFLNQVDIHNPGEYVTTIPDLFCSYGGFKIDHEPSCEDNSVLQNIKDDNSTSVCEIKHKRTDCDYGSFKDKRTIVENELEIQIALFHRPSRRIYKAHGGFDCSAPQYKVIHWDICDKKELISTFTEGEANCASIGATLFGTINGQWEQVVQLLRGENMTLLTGVKYDPEVPGFFNPNGKQKDVEVYLNSSVYEINTDNGFCLCYGPRGDSAYAFSCPCEGEVMRMFSCDLLVNGAFTVNIGSDEDRYYNNNDNYWELFPLSSLAPS